MDRVVYLKTTDSCNLNCKHCYTEGSSVRRYFWDVDKTIDWIHRLMAHIPKEDTVYFELHGGEPFLAEVSDMRKVVSAIRSYGERTGVGATSNLVFLLKPELLEFIAELDGIGTSWDPDIRFANAKQLELWTSNVAKVLQARPNKDFVLNVSVSRAVINMDQEKLLVFLKSTGAYKVQFERLTYDGNAVANANIFPTNAELDDWYMRLHEATKKLDARSWFVNSLLESVYAKFENGFTACGTFCRDCEERLFTINANGTIAGCPNSAPTSSYGHVDMTMEHLFAADKRMDVIVEERSRSEACYSCPVFGYCGSDCHQLSWQGEVCPAPKSLMLELAGMEPIAKKSFKKFIPILSL